MKSNLLVLLGAVLVMTTQACHKSSDPVVVPASSTGSPTPAPAAHVNVQTLGRFSVQDRVSYAHDGKIEIGGISQLFADGLAYIYLNQYAANTSIGGPAGGVNIALLGKSRRCVATVCLHQQTPFGAVDEVFDNGTFRTSGTFYGIEKFDPAFVCNPKAGSVECQVVISD